MKLSERAYHRFKERVFSGDLKPGQMVSQRELIELTGVPLAPMRDALQKLAVEGMVQVFPQRGIKVADVSLKLVRDAYRLRMLIEREAAANFAANASDSAIDAQWSAHKAVVQRAEQAPAAIDADMLAQAQAVDWDMHDAMVAGLDNDLVWSIHETNMDRIRLIRLDRGLKTPEDLFRVMREHLPVLEACRRREPEAAADAMEVHIDSALRRAMGI